MTDVSSRLTAALAERYTIERELGHGGMATVHLAHDVRYRRAVAIKVLRPELSHAIAGERFLREVAIAAQLQSPHILPMLESGEADGLLYYVMPYVEGDALRNVLAARGALPPSEAMRYLRDVVDALAHAHRHGVVHRDIKPDNVMIAERHAVVVDFGIAKAMSDASSQHSLTSIGVSLGTPAYMAPEQAAADPNIDHRADIYSVGVLAYEMLAGRTPFVGTTQAMLAAHITSTPEPLDGVRPELSPAIARVVMTCLEKDPSRRYQTANELLQELESLLTPTGTIGAPLVRPRSPTRRLAIGAAALVALAVVGGLAFTGTTRLRHERWVHRTALPELRRLVEAGKSDSALDLALRIEQVAPRDSTLRALLPAFAQRTVIGSVSPGVAVARASFTDTSRWRALGVTPTDSVWLPNEPGLFRFQQAGRRVLYRVGVAHFDSVRVVADSGPETGMVHVSGGRRGAFLIGTDLAPQVALEGYLVDRFETSNREYKRFVEAGGYRDRKYWEHPFVDEGRTLSFEAAMARFVDRTRRASPSTWVGGDYPAGKGDHPVSGVSWYEAAAYASFAGKSLPTVYHWATAAAVEASRVIVPASNLESEGPLPVGRDRAVAAFGASDMAGNVREWSFNAAGRGERYILGGGWSDPRYAFPDAQAAKPMDRSAVNGIRLARYAASDANLELALRPIVRAFTDYSRETPVSDAVFAGFLPLFDYDPRPLDARLEQRDSTAEDFITEQVSFTTAYGERMTAWVYVPRRGRPPYQSVIIFPTSNALRAGPSTGALDPRLAFLQKSGRLVVLPILKSTFERSDSLTSVLPTPSIFWRDHVVMWVKDIRRTLDYLSTRPDVDSTRFAYFGYSWGANMGGIVPAVEPRFKASVLYVAGFTMERSRPEVDPLHYLPRIKTPVVMLNGKYDFLYPTETAQRPFFERIGTAPERKRYVVYEGGHDVPREQLVGESLAWLDRYLGRVR